MKTVSSSADGNLQEALEKGEISLQGQFLLGSNYTFLVSVTYEGQTIPAVYKPMQGEQPLWDFPPASLAGREVAAYLLGEALGLDLVPFTILREGPYGPGSLQQYIEYDPAYHYFNFTPEDRSRLQTVALFDLLINNADRKGSHVIFEKDSHHLYAIDHGLCFHVDDKLRTVIWEFAGQPIAPELLESLQTIQPRSGDPAGLNPFLLPEEVAALGTRLESLLANPVYPDPPQERRAFPYPPL